MCLKCVNSIPSRLMSDRYIKPWTTTNAKQLIRKKKWLHNYARSSGSVDDWKAYRIAKAIAQHECQKAHKNYLTNLINPESNHTKRYKNQHKDCSGIPALEVNDQVVTDNLRKHWRVK